MTVTVGASGEARRSALIKGLHVLESVGQHERLSDIAARAGLSPSTVHRILADLVEHGWVNQDSDRAYRPGVRVHGLVSLLRQDELLVRLAQPRLEELRDRTGFTVHLAGYQGNGLVYIAKLDGLAAYQMRSAVGNPAPLWSTAVGKAVLSRLDSATVKDLLSRAELVPRSEATIVSKPELLSEIHRVAERGWAMDDGENEPQTRCVGVAVQDASGRPIAGLSISGLSHDMTFDTATAYAPVVVETGQTIEALLRSGA